MTEPLTEIAFAQQLGFMAKHCASWSADMLGPKRPEDLAKPVDQETVDKFVLSMWERLDLVSQWAKPPARTVDTALTLYHHAICGTTPSDAIGRELALRGIGFWRNSDTGRAIWVWATGPVRALRLDEARQIYHQIVSTAA